jgi:hypothetical protein
MMLRNLTVHGFVLDIKAHIRTQGKLVTVGRVTLFFSEIVFFNIEFDYVKIDWCR